MRTPVRKYACRFLAAVTAAAALAGLTGCADEPDTELYFVGDSLVEFWDVDRTCPALRFRNYGLAGAGIAYLGELGGRVAGKDVVLLIGTNDAWRIVSDGAEDYSDRYIAAVNGLRARKIYMYSVLPRTVDTDAAEHRVAISAFNSLTRRRLAEFDCEVVYIDVYDRFLADSEGNINPALSPDGIHLNSYGYEILTEELWKKLK